MYDKNAKKHEEKDISIIKESIEKLLFKKGVKMELQFYKEKIIKDMNNIGTYKEEFMQTIEILAQMYTDMDNAREMFKKSGGNIMIKNPSKNEKWLFNKK